MTEDFNPIKVTPLSIPDVLLIEPQIFKDGRGLFFESFNQSAFNAATKTNIHFVQDNQAESTPLPKNSDGTSQIGSCH